jgi:transcriptional regulator with XRE-family HTH domain
MTRVDIEQQCARKLRELRQRKGLTLEEFEKFSGGEIKAVVLGSYERGTRAISLARLHQLADIYEVDIQYFLSDSEGIKGPAEKLTIDLRKLRKNFDDEELRGIRLLSTSVIARRSDWNGEVLTLRVTDIETLALVEAKTPSELQNFLSLKGALFQRN